MIGLWIDERLTDTERDRIIEHPDPTYDGRAYWNVERGCGCLVGQVLGHDRLRTLHLTGIPPQCFSSAVGHRFPQLAERFGAEHVWRACKLRAAKRNRVNVEGGALATVGAS